MDNSLDVRIYYEDTDCGGVVYYGKYLAYLERARTAFLENRGVDLVSLMKDGYYFVVVHVDITYHKAANYGNILSVHTEIEKVSFATISFNHKIVRKNTDELIVTSSVKLAFVGSNLKPKRLTREINNALMNNYDL